MVDRDILREKYYHGLLPREDIREMLNNPGEYLVRTSEPSKGEKRHFILSAVGEKQNMANHFVIRESEAHKVFVDQKGFDTIVELVNYYSISREAIVTKDKRIRVVLIKPVLRQQWELAHEDVELTKKLGEGAFGEVWKGKLLKVTGADGQPVQVAVKTAKLESLTKEQIKEIMREARLMRNLDHINVVKFYGVAAGTEPLYVIMELADGGALDSALVKLRFPMTKKYELIYQASLGIAYIHEKNLMHRDVAARNCLYGGGQVKISDFGLSREGAEYKMDLKKKVPIRWLPPETIRSGLYTPKTDVFAFGVMAWEITEDGKEPYPGLRVVEVAMKVLQGYRQPFGVYVNKEFSDYVLNKCFCEKYEDRATMAEVSKWMETFVKSQGGNTSASGNVTTSASMEPKSAGNKSRIGNFFRKAKKDKNELSRNKSRTMQVSGGNKSGMK